MTKTYTELFALRQTPRGVVAEIRIYAYPDGHGNIHDLGRKDGNMPVNNRAELEAELTRLLDQMFGEDA